MPAGRLLHFQLIDQLDGGQEPDPPPVPGDGLHADGRGQVGLAIDALVDLDEARWPATIEAGRPAAEPQSVDVRPLWNTPATPPGWVAHCICQATTELPAGKTSMFSPAAGPEGGIGPPVSLS